MSEKMLVTHVTKNKIFKDKAFFLVFFLCLIFFWRAPVLQVYDSNYSMMVSQALIEYGTIRLDKYKIEKKEPFSMSGIGQAGYPYQLESRDERLYYFFPNGSSVLSVPFVAVLNHFGLSAVSADGSYNFAGEVMLEKVIAAFLMSVSACVFYLTSRVTLSRSLSVVIALVGAFATPVLSTASRAMWAHTWLLLLLSCVVLMLWQGIRQKKPPNPILLATVVAWMYFVRPTASISIIAASCIVFMYFRSVFVAYALTGVAWLIGFLIYSQYNFDSFLPSYYAASRIGSATVLHALVGNVLSPGRGLFVYSPFVVSIFFALFVFRAFLKDRLIVFWAVIAIILHWLVVSSFPHWWGGHSYGPRFMTDVVPWLILLGIIATNAAVDSDAGGAQSRSFALNIKLHAVVAFVLVLIGCFMNVRGAYSHDTALWNVRPDNIDQNSVRVWDWRYPQFLAGLIALREYRDYPVFVSGERIYLNSSAADPFLGEGWSGVEPHFRWTEKNTAFFGFKASKGKPVAVALKLAPFVTKGHERQRLKIEANGEFVAEFVLHDQPRSEVRFLIPSSVLKDVNIVELKNPDAISPKDMGISSDPRSLGFAVEFIQIFEL